MTWPPSHICIGGSAKTPALARSPCISLALYSHSIYFAMQDVGINGCY